MDQYYYESGYIEAGYFTYIAEAEIAQNITASVSADFGLLKGVIVNIDPAFTSNFSVNYLVNQVAILSSTATITIDANVIRDVAADLSSQFTQELSFGKIQEAQVSISGAFSPSISINIEVNVFATLDTTASMTTTANKIADNIITLENIANLNAQADKITPNAIDLTASTSLSAVFTKLKIDSAALTAAFSLTANAIEYRARPKPTWNRLANTLEEGYYNTDWTDKTEIYISNQVAYLENPSGDTLRRALRTNDLSSIGNFSSDFCLKFNWYGDNLSDGLPTTPVFAQLGTTTLAIRIYATRVSAGNYKLIAEVRMDTGTVYTLTDPNITNFGNGTWHTITLRRINNVLELYNESGLLASTSVVSTQAVTWQTGRFYFFNPTSNTNALRTIRYDNISLQIGSSQKDFTNIAEIQDQVSATTVFNFDFSNGYADNIGFSAIGASAQTSTATLSAAITRTRDLIALEASSGTLTAVFDKITQASADLSSTFTADITGMFVPFEAEVSLSSTAQLDITLEIIKQAAADFTAFASDMFVAVKTTDVIVLEAGTFTQTTSADRFRDTPVSMTTTAVSDCVPLKIFSLESSQQATAELSANTTDSLTRDITADLTSTSNLTIGLEITKQGQVDLPAVAINMIVTTRLAGLFIDDQVTATMEIDGDVFLSGVSDMSSTANLAVVETRIFDLAANLNTTTTCDIIPVKTTDSVITANSQATEVVDAVKTVNPPITLSAFGNSSFTIWLTKQGDIELASTSSMSITISKTSGVVVALTATATFTPVITKAVNAQITISSQVTFTASGRLVFIEDYVYIVPKETRLWSIARETRSQYIDRETREYIIGD